MVVRRSLAGAIALVFAMLVVGCCPTGPSIRLTPSEVEVAAGGTVSFTASVSCLDDIGVTWTATCGSISGAGSTVTYTAPAEAGACTVTATSVVRSDLSASALVTVTVADPDNGPVGPPPGAVGTLEGTVYMPDGVTPVSDAFVGVPHETEGAGIAARQTTYDVNEDDWVTHTFSGADGSFSLPNAPVGLATLRIIKGQWSRTLQVNVVQGETTTLAPEDTTLPSTQGEGAPNIAVIAGSHDRIQDVLAKIGLGAVDANGRLVSGTEQFDIYQGPTEMEQLLGDADMLANYEIVFVNCGASTQPALLPAVQQNLRTFVSQGGVLYLTDLTFKYVEQAFPGRVAFRTAAGVDGITTDAEVVADDAIGQYFRNWLANGNALNPDGTVHIEGFVGGWAVIDDVDDTVRVWIRGEVSYYDFDFEDFDGWEVDQAGSAMRPCCGPVATSSMPDLDGLIETEVKPLTVSFSHGAGRVLFTSYHTVHGRKRPDLYPQEVVLAGLIFEM